jgi:hypothetical protein
MLQCKIDIGTRDKKARAGAIEYDEPFFEQLRRLAERLLGLTMSSHAAKRSAWNGSLYLTEVIVFAGYQLEFEPALLVV